MEYFLGAVIVSCTVGPIIFFIMIWRFDDEAKSKELEARRKRY